MVENPNEYIKWPLAIKLFYRFLLEKGYLDLDTVFKEIGKIEPDFIEVLRKQF